MRRRYGVLFLAALGLGIAASCQGHRKQSVQVDATRLLDLPVLPGAGTEKDRLRVEVSCSETIPSTAVATLTWRFHAELHDRQRIDLTAYKHGFHQNRYATLWPLKSGQQPRALAVSKLRKRHLEPVLLPRLKSLSRDPRQGSTTATLEGLEAGVVYDFRLVTLKGDAWVPGPAVRVEPPFCVTDEFNETGEP